MSDSLKTTQELMQELASLRARIAELEKEAAQHRQMEEMLRKSEERFRSIFDNSLDAILITKPTGEILSANPAAESLFGMTEEEIRREGRARFAVQDEALAVALEERRRTGRWRGVLTNRRKDGSTYPVELSSNMFTTLEDEVRTITIVRDITERMRLEEERSLSEKKYQDIFEHVPVGLYQVSPEGRFIRANDYAARILGYNSPEELMDSITDIATQIYMDPAKRNEAFRLLEENGRLDNFEVECRHKDGSPVWVSFNAKVVRDGQGNILYHEGVSQDITERKRIERELRDSEERFRLFMDNSPTIAWIKDERGRYVYLSKTFGEHLGMRLEDMIGKTDEELWPPEIAAMYRANDRAVLDAGRPLEVMEEFVSADGSRSHWLSCKFPFRASGNLYIAGIGLDITEHKKAEKALQESEERLRLAQRAARVGVWDWDLHSGKLTWTAELERIHGFEEGTFPGTYESFLERVHPDDREKMERLFGEAVHSRNPFDFDFRIQLPSGETRWVNDKGSPFYDKAGNLRRILGVNVDITERKKTEEELAGYRERLETLVKERTRELEEKTHILEELNAATKVLLRHREEDRKELEERFVANIKNLLLPYAEKLKGTRLDERQKSYLSIMETHLDEVLSPLVRTMQHHNLTPTESRVATLIRDGRTTKEIAAIMEVATSSIDTHRKSIRKKLGLSNAKVNLQSHLRSMEI